MKNMKPGVVGHTSNPTLWQKDHKFKTSLTNAKSLSQSPVSQGGKKNKGEKHELQFGADFGETTLKYLKR